MIHFLIKTEKVLPDAVVKTVYDIDYQALAQSGKKNLLIDLDNTLISYQEDNANDALKSLIQTLISIGFFVCIVSNSGPDRVMPVASALNVPYVAYAKKPTRSGLKKALSIVEGTIDNTLFIGDQLMTDVFAAKRMNMAVILVKPIQRKTEKWYTRFNRAIESKMLHKMAQSHPAMYQKIIETVRDTNE